VSDAGLQNALRLRQAGRFAEAAEIYSEILRGDPKHFEALHALGIVRYQCGQLEHAEQLIAEAVRVNPRASDALYNRGSLLLRLERINEALACFDQALAVKPDYAEALGNRGAAYMRVGRHREAFADFSRLAELKPGVAEAWFNRGGALVKLGRYEEAHASYEKALAIRPDYLDARKHRGAVSLALNHYADALADADRILARNSQDAEVWELRANALAELNRREEALASYDRAIGMRPQSVNALYNRANNLMALRRFDDAKRDYAEVLRIDPDYYYAAGNLAFSKLLSCDWSDFAAQSVRIVSGIRAEKPVAAAFQALLFSSTAEEAAAAARLWSSREYPPASEALWRGEVYRHAKIRVAYLSANFHDHAVARLITGVLEHHDHERFEITAISYGPDDNGFLRGRLRRACDCFIDVQSQSVRQIAKLLRQSEIDIAVDLMGFTEGCRPGILAHRPAPAQVNYLGYPGSMAADYVDYIVADAVVIPERDKDHYREKVIHLPHSYLPGDDKRAIAASLPSRSDAGLPENGFVFCCFNNTYKFTPAIFDVWMELLRGLDGSVLWLSQASPVARRNLQREAAARSIASDRLVFAPHVKEDAEHLARLRLAGLFLDTIPYNAHATASDALWAGVPVVTMAGPAFPGRVAASLLHAAGLPELIASSMESYKQLAFDFARNPRQLGALKDKLDRNRLTQKIFDTASFTRDLESAYAAMWERSERGLPPASFAAGNPS
jgi:protein O-GlcNAc transferase